MSTERRSTGPRGSPAWAGAPSERCTGWRTSRLASSVQSKRYAKENKMVLRDGHYEEMRHSKRLEFTFEPLFREDGEGGLVFLGFQLEAEA